MKCFKLIVSALLALALCAVPAVAEEGLAATLRLVMTEGDIVVYNPAGTEVDIAEDMRLFNGYTVTTLEKSYAWITLDGTKACKLDESSAVKIEKADNMLKLTLESGAMFFDVTEKLGADESMEIATATMVTGIRGTSGEFVVDEKMNTTFALLDGVTEVSAVNEDGTLRGEPILLQPGQSAEAYFIDYSKAAQNNLIGDSTLKEAGPVDPAKLGNFTLTEVANNSALQARIEEGLTDKILSEYEERAAQYSDYGDSTNHMHQYPEEMVRTYDWTTDLKFCTASVYCALCSELLTETQPSVIEELRAYDCTQTGKITHAVDFTHWAFADRAALETVAALGHDWDAPTFEWPSNLKECTATFICRRDASHVITRTAQVTERVTEDPACETEGEKVYTAKATLNGTSYTDRRTVTLAATGHSWKKAKLTWTDGVNEMVTKGFGAVSGCTAASSCANCSGTRIATTAKVYSQITREPTCTAPGCTTYRAEFDDSFFGVQTGTVEDIPMVPHELAAAEAALATCTEGGVETYWTCKFCKKMFADASGEVEISAPKTVAALGHKLQGISYEWTETGADSNMHYQGRCTASTTCGRCMDTVSETVFGAEEIIGGNCGESYDVNLVATFKNSAFEKQTLNMEHEDAREHVWQEPAFEWADDYASATATSTCKRSSEHTNIAECSVDSEIVNDETCTEDGLIRYTAKVTMPGTYGDEEYTNVKEIPIPAKHDCLAPGYAWSSDMTVCTAFAYCVRCNEQISEVATASTVIVPPTCDLAGHTSQRVVFENPIFEEQSAVILYSDCFGHDWGSPSFAWNGYEDCTIKFVCVRDASHVLTASCEVNAEVIRFESEDEEGEILWTAKYELVDEEYNTKVYTSTKTEIVPPLG